MRDRATAARLSIALSAALTLATVSGCRRSDETPTPPSSGGGGFVYAEPPSGLPKLAAAAMKQARSWHADAVLVNVEIKSDGSQFNTTFEFYAPSDMTGYVVTTGPGPQTAQSVGAVSWGTLPIPPDFADFPDAVAAMRARGMKGLVSGGTLTEVKLCATMPVMRWEVTPASGDQPPSVTGSDVYFYASPESGAPPMDSSHANDLADRALKGDVGALASLRDAAERGDPNAATDLGYVLAVGAPGAARDYSQAGAWSCAAGYQGSPAAQFNYGLLFDKGWIGDPGSMSNSVPPYYTAANQGMAQAQLNLGVVLWKIHADSDLNRLQAQARDWWQKAAAQGVDAANKNIAALGAWNSQTMAFNQVTLLETSDFAKASAWNPPAKGLIPYSKINFPDRPTLGWTQND